jgi:ubiquinone/menaquinone biosynthesis C-methylase UbiE
MSQLNPQDWKDLWDRRFQTSIEIDYDAEILDFWKQHIIGDISHLVDMACGNGALSWIADDILNGSQATVSGVDFADIDPFSSLEKNPAEHPNIEFIGNTPIESLPFNDDSIDMAISQWGLEYSNLEQSIPELGRVLKPRAKVAFVCHHQNSAIIKDSRIKVQKHYAVLNDGNIFGHYLALDKLYNSKFNIQQVNQDPVHTSILGELKQDLTRLQGTLSSIPDPNLWQTRYHLQELNKLFANPSFVRNPGRKQQILDIKANTQMTVGRLEDLFSAALSPEQLKQLQDLLEREGFTVVHNEPLIHRGDDSTVSLGDVGMAIVATRG